MGYSLPWSSHFGREKHCSRRSQNSEHPHELLLCSPHQYPVHTMNHIQTYCHYVRMAEINALGVSLMQKGDYSEAIACFEGGLAQLITQFLAEPFGRETTAFNQLRGISPYDHPTSQLPFPGKVAGEFRSPSREARTIFSVDLFTARLTDNDDIFTMFDRPLHLAPSSDDLRNNCTFCSNILSAIVMFNCALAYHLEGQRTAGNSRILLARALDFYFMAYAAFSDSCNDHDAILSLPILATVTNAGHIYASHFRLEETRICNDELTIRLSELLTRPFLEFSAISDDEYKIFFLNICFFQKSELVSAPAA